MEGYILTFSITEHQSFQYVHDLVYEIRQEEGSSKAVIVVANKSDLVRTREVTEEGQSIFACDIWILNCIIKSYGSVCINKLISMVFSSLCTEAIELCQSNDCKYVEVSAALNHRVDDLLVGIVKQIRLNSKREKKHRKMAEQRQAAASSEVSSKMGTPLTEKKDSGCVQTAKGFLGKLFKKQSSSTNVSKSCDNLLVLWDNAIPCWFYFRFCLLSLSG